MWTFARSLFFAMTLTLGAAAPAVGVAEDAKPAAAQPPEDTWNSIRDDIFKGRPILDGTGVVTLEAPHRAEDAAIVPITMSINLPAGDARWLRVLTLVIDENPAPVAGTFTVGPHAGVTKISTRVRVNTYSYVRAVAELSDGQLYGVKSYVKASGGCSAPAASNADAARSTLGQMKFRAFPPAPGALPEAQIMLRHPQNSGLQMDQVTRLYVPPFFVETLEVWQGDELVLALDGGIAISEDPNLRFNYRPNGSENFRVKGFDTSKNVFKGEWQAEKSML